MEVNNQLEFIDYLEFWVSNSKSFIKSYLEPLGFFVIGYNNLAQNHRVQYLLLNSPSSSRIENASGGHLPKGEYQFVIVTSSLSSEDNEFHNQHRKHGDFVKNIAFYSNDVDFSYTKATRLDSSIKVLEPTTYTYNNDKDSIQIAIIQSPFPDLLHTFIRKEINSSTDNPLALFPEFKPISNIVDSFYQESESEFKDTIIQSLDHIACCVHRTQLPLYIKWYYDCMGFKLLSDQSSNNNTLNQMEVESPEENEFILNQNYYIIEKSDFKYTKKKENLGMKMVVLSNQPSCSKSCQIPSILMVFAEGVEGGNGQVEQYIKYHNDAGVQHLAFRTKNIFEAVQYSKSNKLEFVRVPNSYYQNLPSREELKSILPKFSKEFLQNLLHYRILLDADNTQSIDGYIKQIFTKYVSDKPTLFFELIERSSAMMGFGKGNIIALFESLEIEIENSK